MSKSLIKQELLNVINERLYNRREEDKIIIIFINRLISNSKTDYTKKLRLI